MEVMHEVVVEAVHKIGISLEKQSACVVEGDMGSLSLSVKKAINEKDVLL